MDRSDAGALGLGILVGAAIGLAIGILYAPKSGQETREYIREKAGDIVEKVKEKASAIRGKDQEKVYE